MANDGSDAFDLLIVGGGINGAGIARDAAGRGLTVLLVERDDLASHTSSASTKLIHGGLRYLEYGEFRLVHEALRERERLLKVAPHLIRPLDFVLPQTASPRPAWMVRLGLWIYDHIGGRTALPGTRTIDLRRSAFGEGLANRDGKAFVYSDGWVDDARLVVLNALGAAERGAAILTRTAFVSATREAGCWRAVIEDVSGRREIRARAIVNAAGPWVADVIGRVPAIAAARGVRLVKGSHIVVPRLHEGAHAVMMQNDDRRVVFAIPYEGAYTLVGTTDEPWSGPPAAPCIDEAETDYLLATIGRYFARTMTRADIVWSYSGIRPLYDDGSKNASAVTRDYVLELDGGDGEAPMLSVFGGKITTYRRLAERALHDLARFFPDAGPAWTADAQLPGGNMTDADFARFLDGLIAEYSGIPAALVHRLARAYGTRARTILGPAQRIDDLGIDFGGGLYAIEVDHLIAHEWARTAEDILWRRSKLGLHVPPGTAERLDAYMQAAR